MVTRARRTVSGVEVHLVGVSHADPVAARSVTAVIAAARPAAVLLEASPDRLPRGSDAAAAATAAPLQPLPPARPCFAGLLPIAFALWSAASSSTLAALLSGGAAGSAYGGELQAAMDAGRAVGARLVAADRHVSVSLARAAPELTLAELLRSAPSLVACAYLPPHAQPSPLLAATLLAAAAQRHWGGVADALRDALLAAGEGGDPLYAPSPLGRAAAAWNGLLLRRIREGRAGGGDPDGPALRDALSALLRAQAQQQHASAQAQAQGITLGGGGDAPPAALTQASLAGAPTAGFGGGGGGPAAAAALHAAFVTERDELLAHVLAAMAADEAARAAAGRLRGGAEVASGSAPLPPPPLPRASPCCIVAVVGDAHLPGILQRLDGGVATLPVQRVAQLLQPPPWHAVSAVYAPALAATGAAVLAARAFGRASRLGKGAAAACVLAAAAGGKAVASGCRALHARIAGDE